MPRCFVLNCGNYYSRPNQKPVRYHTFPTSKKLCVRWAVACRGVYKTPVPKYARVCSEHFSSSCYKRDLQHELLGLPVRHRLRPDAVPDLKLPGKQEEKIQEKNLEKPEKNSKITKVEQNVLKSDKMKIMPDLKLINNIPKVVKKVTTPSKQQHENMSPNNLINTKIITKKRKSDTDVMKANKKTKKIYQRNSLESQISSKKMALRMRDEKVVYATIKKRKKPVKIEPPTEEPKKEEEVKEEEVKEEQKENKNKFKEVPPLIRKINENDVRLKKDSVKDILTPKIELKISENIVKHETKSTDDIDLKEIVEIIQQNRSQELEADQKLPVRSSIRIAKKNSIKHTSGPGIEPKSPRSREINEKLKFMAKFNLRFGFNPGRELKKCEQDLIIQTDKIDTKETIKQLKNRCESFKKVHFELSDKVKSDSEKNNTFKKLEFRKSCIVSPKNTLIDK